MAINISRSSPPLPKTTQAVSASPISISRDTSIRSKSASSVSDVEVTTTPTDLTKYVELKDGTYIDKESFDELPKKFQQIGKTQGYEALRTALMANNRDFKEIETTHIKLADDKYISQEDWAAIDAKYQKIGLSEGFDAMTEAMQVDWESDHVKLADDTWVSKSEFEELSEKYQKIALSKGLEAMNDQLKADNKEALKEYESELKEFEKNYIEIEGKYYERDLWNSLTDEQQDQVKELGYYYTTSSSSTPESSSDNQSDDPNWKPNFSNDNPYDGVPDWYIAKIKGTKAYYTAIEKGWISSPWKPDFNKDNPWEGMPDDYAGKKTYVATAENPLPPWIGEIVGYTTDGAQVYNADGELVTIKSQEEYQSVLESIQAKALEVSTKIFEKDNIKLFDGKYITRDVYNALTPEQKIVADTQGYDALVSSLTQLETTETQTVEVDSADYQKQQDALDALEDYKITESGISVSDSTLQSTVDASRGITAEDLIGAEISQAYSYDLAKYLRDGGNEQTLIDAGFGIESIESAKEYNRITRGIGQPDYVSINEYREQYFAEKGWGIPEIVKSDTADDIFMNYVSGTDLNLQQQELIKQRIKEADESYREIYTPQVSQEQFMETYLEDKGYETLSELKRRKQLSGETNDDYYNRLQENDAKILEALNAYTSKYGKLAVVQSGVAKVAQFAFVPARAIAPEVKVSDISGMEWMVGGAQVALIVAPVVGGTLSKVIGTTASKIATTAVELSATGVFTVDAVQNWDKMTPIEKAISASMIGVIFGATVINPIKTIIKGGKTVQTIENSIEYGRANTVKILPDNLKEPFNKTVIAQKQRTVDLYKVKATEIKLADAKLEYESYKQYSNMLTNELDKQIAQRELSSMQSSIKNIEDELINLRKQFNNSDTNLLNTATEYANNASKLAEDSLVLSDIQKLPKMLKESSDDLVERLMNPRSVNEIKADIKIANEKLEQTIRENPTNQNAWKTEIQTVRDLKSELALTESGGLNKLANQLVKAKEQLSELKTIAKETNSPTLKELLELKIKELESQITNTNSVYVNSIKQMEIEWKGSRDGTTKPFTKTESGKYKIEDYPIKEDLGLLESPKQIDVKSELSIGELTKKESTQSQSELESLIRLNEQEIKNTDYMINKFKNKQSTDDELIGLLKERKTLTEKRLAEDRQKLALKEKETEVSPTLEKTLTIEEMDKSLPSTRETSIAKTERTKPKTEIPIREVADTKLFTAYPEVQGAELENVNEPESVPERFIDTDNVFSTETERESLFGVEPMPELIEKTDVSEKVSTFDKTILDVEPINVFELEEKTVLDTELEPITGVEVEPITKIETESELELQEKLKEQTKVEPETKLQTELATKLVSETDVSIKTKTKMLIKDGDIPDNVLTDKGQVKPGTIEWRQGNKWVVIPPRDDGSYHNEDKVYLDKPLQGTYKFAVGKGSAAKTLQVLGGVPRSDADIDMGWANVHISAKNKQLTMNVKGGKEAAETRWSEYEQMQDIDKQAYDFDGDGIPEGEITQGIPRGYKRKNVAPTGLQKVELPQYRMEDGTRVYLVNGNFVRHNYDTDFTQGGHSKVYPEFIPSKEIWIDRALDTSIDRKATLLHEIKEYKAMGSAIGKGKEYEESHSNIANPSEQKARSNPEQIDGMLSDEIGKDIEDEDDEIEQILSYQPVKTSRQPKQVVVKNYTNMADRYYLGRRLRPTNLGSDGL